MAKTKMQLPSELYKDKNAQRNSLIKLQIFAFFGMLAIGFFVAVLLIPIRPTVSVTEKRELQKFPQFSVASLAQGEYFRGIESWFSDTFPARDFCVSVKYYIDKSKGINLNKTDIHGNVTEGDDIPSEVFVPDISESTVPEEVSSEPPVSSNPPEKNVDGLDTQALGALLIVDDSAYEYYNFDKEVANNYISHVAKAAGKLSGRNTYCMVIPNSMDIILPQSLRDNLKTSDQRKAIDYIYGSMGDSVKTIPVYDALKAHCDEYIYFRTDHHWTALGAYYAYQKMCELNQWSVRPVEEYTTQTFDNFLGSFYVDSGKKPDLKKNPDVITAYEPPVDTSFKYTDRKGNTVDWHVISDVSGWNSAAKYSTFVGGDNPYSVITNNDAQTERSCVVIKDSFANALIPFMVENYKTIHIIDFRYWSGKIDNFVKTNNVDDIYFINNISMTRNKSLVGKLGKIV